MSKVRFEEIERGIAETRARIGETNATQAAIDERLRQVIGEQQLQTVDVDTTDQDFRAVVENQAKMQGNIASLVYGLDEITKTFGSEFKTLSDSTFGEKMMSIFSRQKAEEMKAQRVRNADIRTNLNQLIQKSEVIRGLLEEQLAIVDDRLDASKTGQASVLEQAKQTAAAIEEIDLRLDELGPKVAELDGRIADATGEALKALGLAYGASFVGGMMSIAALILL